MQLLVSSSALAIALIGFGFAAGVTLLWCRRTAPMRVLVPIGAICILAHLCMLFGIAGVISPHRFALSSYTPLVIPAGSGRLDEAMVARLRLAIDKERLAPEQLIRALDAGGPMMYTPPKLLWLVEEDLRGGTLPAMYADPVAQWFAAALAKPLQWGFSDDVDVLTGLLTHHGLTDGAFAAAIDALTGARPAQPNRPFRNTEQALFNVMFSGRCSEKQIAAILERLQPAEFRIHPAAAVVGPGALIQIESPSDQRTASPLFESVIDARAKILAGDFMVRGGEWDLGPNIGERSVASMRAAMAAGAHTVDVQVERELSPERLRSWLSLNPDRFTDVKADLRKLKSVRSVTKQQLSYTVTPSEPATIMESSEDDANQAMKAVIRQGSRSWIRRTNQGMEARQELSISPRKFGGAFDVIWKFGGQEVTLGWVSFSPERSGTVVVTTELARPLTAPDEVILRANLELVRNTAEFSPCYNGEDIVLEPRVMQIGP